MSAPAAGPEQRGWSAGDGPPRIPSGRRLAAGATAKLAGEALTRLASFGILLWAARHLGPTGFGTYLYGLGTGFVLGQGADLGLQLLVSREAAAIGASASPLVRTALGVKLWLSAIAALVLVVLSGGQPFLVHASLLALGWAMVLQTFVEFAAHVFRGNQQLGREVGLLTSTRLFSAAACALVLWRDGNLLQLSAAVLATSAIGGGVAVWLLYREAWLVADRPPLPVGTPSVPLSRLGLLREALPLGVAIVLSAVYLRVGWILTYNLSGDEAVAQLGIAQRLVEAAQLVPAAVIAAIFPAYTRAFWSEGHGGSRLGPTSAAILATLGFAAAGTLWWAAGGLVPVLFGRAYLEAVPVLRVFALALPLMYLNYLLTHLVIARGSQRLLAWFGAVMLGVHVLASWILIQRWGAVGVASSTVAAEAVLFLCCAAALRADPRDRRSGAGPETKGERLRVGAWERGEAGPVERRP